MRSRFSQTQIRNQNMIGLVAIQTIDSELGRAPHHLSVTSRGQQIQALLVDLRCLKKRYPPKSYLGNSLEEAWAGQAVVSLVDRSVRLIALLYRLILSDTKLTEPIGAGFDSPGFVFNLGGFGGPGVRVHQFGGPTPRRRPATHGQPNETSLFSSLLPLLILFVLPLLSSLFGSGSSWSSSSSTYVSFDRVPPYTQPRTSTRLGVPYFVDPVTVHEFSSRQWKDLDKSAESRYVQKLGRKCEDQRLRRESLFREAQGWFSVDEEKERQAREVDMSSCRKLRELGISF